NLVFIACFLLLIIIYLYIFFELRISAGSISFSVARDSWANRHLIRGIELLSPSPEKLDIRNFDERYLYKEWRRQILLNLTCSHISAMILLYLLGSWSLASWVTRWRKGPETGTGPRRYGPVAAVGHWDGGVVPARPAGDDP